MMKVKRRQNAIRDFDDFQRFQVYMFEMILVKVNR
jgi:hypothetical protein